MRCSSCNANNNNEEPPPSLCFHQNLFSWSIFLARRLSEDRRNFFLIWKRGMGRAVAGGGAVLKLQSCYRGAACRVRAAAASSRAVLGLRGVLGQACMVARGSPLRHPRKVVQQQLSSPAKGESSIAGTANVFEKRPSRKYRSRGRTARARRGVNRCKEKSAQGGSRAAVCGEPQTAAALRRVHHCRPMAAASSPGASSPGSSQSWPPGAAGGGRPGEWAAKQAEGGRSRACMPGAAAGQAARPVAPPGRFFLLSRCPAARHGTVPSRRDFLLGITRRPSARPLARRLIAGNKGLRSATGFCLPRKVS